MIFQDVLEIDGDVVNKTYFIRDRIIQLKRV